MSKNTRVKRAAYRRSVKDLWDRIFELRRKILSAEQGALQLRKIMDALLIQAAVGYGDKTEDGYLMKLPNEAVEDVLAGYKVFAEKDDQGQLIVKVTKM